MSLRSCQPSCIFLFFLIQIILQYEFVFHSCSLATNDVLKTEGTFFYSQEKDVELEVKEALNTVAATSQVQCSLVCKNTPGCSSALFYGKEDEKVCKTYKAFNNKVPVLGNESSKKAIRLTMKKKTCDADSILQNDTCIAVAKRSCMDVRNNLFGKVISDGFYSVDINGDGNYEEVYCDMNTDGGGWTLASHLQGTSITSDPALTLPNTLDYLLNGKKDFVLSITAFGTLRSLINFNQIRLKCFKSPVGRHVDIATARNTTGKAAVDYFTNTTISDTPDFCGSYEILPEDTSRLSKECGNMGYDGAATKVGQWSYKGASQEYKFLLYPIHGFFKDGIGINTPVYGETECGTGCNKWDCDDNSGGKYASPKKEDYFRIFVR